MGLINTLLMKCEDATAVVEKKRDGKLSFAEKIGLWIHLAYCGLCKKFFHQTQVLDKSYQHYADEINGGYKTYPMDPARKEAMSHSFHQELNK